MLRGGVELLAGLVQDPLFGPLVAFGPGGVLAELIGEASFRIAPLTDVDAGGARLDRQGRPSRRRLPRRAGGRRRSARRISCTGSSRLAEDLPSVTELDLNPVIALPTGCVAVDARVRVTQQRPVAGPKTW